MDKTMYIKHGEDKVEIAVFDRELLFSVDGLEEVFNLDDTEINLRSKVWKRYVSNCNDRAGLFINSKGLMRLYFKLVRDDKLHTEDTEFFEWATTELIGSDSVLIEYLKENKKVLKTILKIFIASIVVYFLFL